MKSCGQKLWCKAREANFFQLLSSCIDLPRVSWEEIPIQFPRSCTYAEFWVQLGGQSDNSAYLIALIKIEIVWQLPGWLYGSCCHVISLRSLNVSHISSQASQVAWYIPLSISHSRPDQWILYFCEVGFKLGCYEKLRYLFLIHLFLQWFKLCYKFVNYWVLLVRLSVCYGHQSGL